MDLKTLNEQAKAALQAGDMVKAEALIAQLGAVRPGHPQVILLTGLLRGQQGRYQEAANQLENLLRLDPRNANVLLHLGNALQGLGRFEEAVARYDAALAVKPGAADILS